MSLEKSLEVIKQQCVTLFNKHGYHEPMFMLKKDDGIQMLGCIWSGKIDKDYTIHIIKKMIKNREVKELIFIGEAWVATGDKKDNEQFEQNVRKVLDSNGSLEHFPNRKEALIVQYSSPTREVMYNAEIDRSGESVKVGDWTCIEDESPSHKFNNRSGRFQNIFTSMMAESN